MGNAVSIWLLDTGQSWLTAVSDSKAFAHAMVRETMRTVQNKED